MLKLRRHSSRLYHVVVFAALGTASGTAATLVPRYGPDWRFAPHSWFDFQSLTVAPGLAFGLITGFALYRRGLARPWGYAAYVIASTVAYFSAVMLTLQVLLDALGGPALAGMAAGLFGGALLTGAMVLLLPFVRRVRSCVLMIGSGAVLGGLLEFVDTEGDLLMFTLLLLFGSWQAGYAASLATAIPLDGQGQSIEDR
jgi:hypothetical protein